LSAWPHPCMKMLVRNRSAVKKLIFNIVMIGWIGN
jgi:hypothetical protein